MSPEVSPFVNFQVLQEFLREKLYKIYNMKQKKQQQQKYVGKS